MSNEELLAFLRKNVICVACVVASLVIGGTIYLRSDELPAAEKVFADNAQKAALLRLPGRPAGSTAWTSRR